MPQDPRTIGRYEVEAELGRGSMGIVHRAHDPVMDRSVAIKTILLPHGLERDRRADFRERFLREAQAAGRLSHPGIVTVYEYDQGPDGALPFIAMEYVEGPNLHELICKEGALNADWALGVVETLAGGLEIAHGSGVVHRDLKPSNVLVRASDGVAKIVDFGVARVNEATAGATYGSPAYTAPECIRGKAADARSDLYSLGVILYEALSGRRPFEERTYDALCHAITHDAPGSILLHEPDLSPALEPFFARALAKDPAERFQDAPSFREAVAALRKEQHDWVSGVSTRPVPQARRGVITWARAIDPAVLVRRWRVIGPAALLGLVLAFGAGWALRGARSADVPAPAAAREAPAPKVTVPPAPPRPASAAPARAKPARATAPGSGAKKPAASAAARPAAPEPTPRSQPLAAATAKALAEPVVEPATEAEAPAAVAPEAAHLDVVVKSSIKLGTLRLLVDGQEHWSSDLAAETAGVALAFKKTLGKADQHAQTRLSLPPGPHTLRAQVFSVAKAKEFEDTLEIDLTPGETRSLSIVAGRAIGRRVAIRLE